MSKNGEQLNALLGKALLAKNSGNYLEAIDLYKIAIPMIENSEGRKNTILATITHHLAVCLVKIGRYEEAIPFYQKAISIEEKLGREGNTDFAMSLANLGACYRFLKRYQDALPFYERAYKIEKNIYGENHPKTIKTILNLSDCFLNLQNYEKALAILKDTLPRVNYYFGYSHPITGTVLNNIGNCYLYQKNFDKAEQHFADALKIAQKNCTEDPGYMLNILINLSRSYLESDQYGKAIPGYEKCIQVSREIYGSRHPRITFLMDALARCYSQIGNYEKAISLYQEALLIGKEAQGFEISDLAVIQANFSTCYRLMGNYEEALALLKKSQEMIDKYFPEDDLKKLLIYQKASTCYHSMGDLVNAYKFGLKAWFTADKIYGAHNEETLALSLQLGLITFGMGIATGIDDFIKEAKHIFTVNRKRIEKSPGIENMLTVDNLTDLAGWYSYNGDFKKALSIHQKVFERNQKQLGEAHPKTIQLLGNLACAYVSVKQFDDAFKTFVRLFEQENHQIANSLHQSSEDQSLLILENKENTLNAFLSFLLLLNPEQCNHAFSKGLEITLKRKGILFEIQKLIQKTYDASSDEEFKNLFAKLNSIRNSLMQEIWWYKPNGEVIISKSYMDLILDLKRQEREIEIKLLKKCNDYDMHLDTFDFTLTDIISCLPVGSALIEIIKIKRFDFYTVPRIQKNVWRSPRYIAFLVRAAEPDHVEIIDLGEAGILEKTIHYFRFLILISWDNWDNNAIKKSIKLYELLFKPLRERLGDEKLLYISPGGDITFLPFETLQDEVGNFLIEKYDFNYLNTGRELLRPGRDKKSNQKSLLIGNPNFNYKEEKSEKAAKSSINKNFADKLIFSSLPETRAEVEAIYNLLGKDNAYLFMDDEAKEEVLSGYQSPKILHIATHGFFLAEIDCSYTILGETISKDDKISYSPDIKKYVSPLMRSGIALAGSNISAKSGSGFWRKGIFTASKVLALNLADTEMVVLSACNTGMGVVKDSEGIFGLRRAFMLAGAQSIVMSMWDVPDKETKELILQFYKNIITLKMNPRNALRSAAIRQKKIVKRRYGHISPFYWGAFIFLGKP